MALTNTVGLKLASVSNVSRRSIARQLSTTTPALATDLEPRHTDISGPLKNVSKLSGSGPFASGPEFQLLGLPFTSALHVSLPSSSSLYLKAETTAIGITGDVTKPTSTLEYSVAEPLECSTETPIKPDSLPLAYQKVTTASSLTLLLSAAPNVMHRPSWYTLISPTKSFHWLVKRDAVLAWGGPQLSLRPVSNAIHKSLSVFRRSQSPIVVSGEGGQLALTSDALIYKLRLTRGEQIFLRPDSIIALTVPTNVAFDSLLAIKQTLFRIPHLPLPSLSTLVPLSLLPVANTLKSWCKALVQSLPPNVKHSFGSVGRYWKRSINAVNSVISQYLWQDDILVKLEGPATILLDNRPPSLVFDKLTSSSK